MIVEVGYDIGSRIYISEVEYTHRKLDMILEFGYTYQKLVIHFGSQIYILDVGYTYRIAGKFGGGKV